MAYILGEAALRVTPNMEGFHNRIKNDQNWKRAKDEEINIPVKLDKKTFDRQLKMLEDDIDRVDGKVIELKVEIDDDSARKQLNRLQETVRDNPLKVRTKMDEESLKDSQRVMDAFKRDNDIVHSHLFLDRHHADEEMRDFRRKHEGKVITQRLKIETPDDIPSAKLGGRDRDQAAYAAIARKAMQREWSIISLVPDLISKMDEQVEAGMRQIYDPYLRTIGRVYNQMMRPLRGLRDLFNQAKTMGEFNESLVRSFDGIREKAQDFITTYASGLYRMQSGIQRASASIRRFGQDAGIRMGLIGGYIQHFLTYRIHEAGRAFQRIGEQARGFAQRMVSSLREFGPAMQMSFLLTLHNIRHGLELVTERAGKFGRAIFDGLSNENLMRLARLRQGFIDLSGSLRSIASGWSRAIVGTVMDLGKQFAAARSNMAGMAQWISAPIFTAIYGLRDRIINGIIGPIMGHLAGVFDKIGRPIMSGLSKIGNSINDRVLKPMRSALGSVANQMRGVFAASSNLIANYTTQIRAQLGGIGDNLLASSRRWGGALSGLIGNYATMFRAQLGGIGSNLLATTSRWGAQMSSRFVATVGPMGRRISKVFASGLNDRMAWQGFQRIVSRMGMYIAGFTRIAIGSFSRVGGVIMKSLLPAILAAVAGLALMAGQVLIAGILALGGAILSVAQGAMLMAPALVAAAGISFMALKIGLEDVKAGVSAAFTEDSVEEFEEAIAGMPPAVRDIARAFREFKPAMDEMTAGIKQNMLGGLAPAVSGMMSNLFPVISSGMQELATEWNGALRMGLEQLGADESRIGLANIMDKTNEAAKNMQPVLANLIAAFGDLADQGANHLPAIGQWAADITQNFKEWAASLRTIDEGETMSRFDLAIERAKTNLGYLSAIFGGLFGTIGNVFAAGAEGGGGMLAGMAGSMQRLNEETKRGTENFEAIKNFMTDAESAASKLGDVLGPAFGVVADVGSILMRVADGAIPGFVAAFEGLGEGLAPIKDIALGFGENLSVVIASLGPAFAALGPVLAPLLEGLGGGFAAIFEQLGPVMTSVIDSFAPFAAAFGPAIVTVGEALGKVFVALGPIMESSGSLMTAMVPALERMFFWIGEVGSKILEVITPLLTGHDQSMQRLLDNIVPIIDILGEGLLNILERVAPIVPRIAAAFDAFVMAIALLLPYLEPVFDFFMFLLEHAVNIFVDLATVIVPVVIAFKAISFIMGVLSTVGSVLMGIIKGIGVAWRILSFLFAASPIGLVITLIAALVAGLIYFFTQTETGQEIWRKFTEALGNAWESFTNWVSEKWAYLRDVVWENIKQKIGELGSRWSDFTQGMSDKWGEFKDKITDIWNQIVTGVMDRVSPVLDGVRNAFSSAVDRIKDIWNGLRKVVAQPIVFFLEEVINGGLIAGWNGAMGLINKEDEWGLKPIAVPDSLKFAQGGVLPGYTPGRDPHKFYSPTAGAIELSGGEAIMRPEWTRAIGGPRAVHQMNKDARAGRLRSPGLSDQDRRRLNAQHSHADGGVINYLGAFARGGVLEAMEAIVGAKYPQLVPMYSGYRPGGPYHGTWQAGDFSNGVANTPAQNALAMDIAQTYPGSAELIYEMPGFDKQIKDGSYVGPGGGSYGFYAGAGNHANHVHWAMTVPPTMPFGGGVFEGGSGGGGGGGLLPVVTGVLSKFLGSDLTDKISGFAESFGRYGQLAIGFGKELISKGITAIKEKLTDLLPGWMRGGGGSSFEPGAGAQQWRAGIIEAFRRQGENPTDERVEALLRQIDTESGGNPNIAQQIVDVNGTGPSAGLGLYQFIPGTFAAYRDPSLPNDRTDPDAAHNAAVRYFRDRHGWNTGPGGVGRGHGWKDGGVLPLFDRGGVANGIGVMEKRTLHPERVLSPMQTRAFNDFVYRFMPQLIEDFRKQPFTLREGFDRVVNELSHQRGLLADRREAEVEGLADRMALYFEHRDRVRLNPIDTNLNEGWWGRNGDKLMTNLRNAVAGSEMAVRDPWGYLEAEERAKEKLAKKQESDLEEKRTAEDEAIKERHKEELDAIDEEDKDARDKMSERHTEEMDAIRKRRSEEDEALKARKESGEYYYGYKVLNNDGTNPNEYERSDTEEAFLSFMDSMASMTGMSGPWGKVAEKLPVLQSIGSGIETAMPAWLAAASGDYTGLNHNIAATQARAYENTEAELRDLAPSALAGAIEMAVSRSAVSNQQPFIGEVHTGMTRAEFRQEMSLWESRHSRAGTGTARTRGL